MFLALYRMRTPFCSVPECSRPGTAYNFSMLSAGLVAGAIGGPVPEAAPTPALGERSGAPSGVAAFITRHV